MPKSDDYGIYRRPSALSLLALACLAAALFCGSWAVNLRRQVAAEAENQRTREELNRAALQEKDREIAAMTGRLRDLQNEMYEAKIRLGIAENRLKMTGGIAPENSPAMPAAASAPPAVAAQPQNLPAPSAKNAAAENYSRETAAPIAESRLSPLTKNSETAAVATVEKNAASAENETLQLADAELLAGQILSYNPDYQRVYLSLGSANGGVEPGNRFSIWRGGEYVTDVEVVKVYSVTSTCKVLNGAPDGLQIGDIARRARPTVGAL